MRIKELIENNYKSFWQTAAIFVLAGSLVVLGIIFPKSSSEADSIQDNTAGSWQGTIGSGTSGNPGTDVDFRTASVGIAYNATFSRTEAGLSSGQTTGLIRSAVIAPTPSTSWKSWKKLKFGFDRPTTGSSTVTIDILCGDSSQTSCPTYDQPIAGYTDVPLNASDEYDIPSSLTAKMIKLRVNFSRTNIADMPILLYDWQVFWEINSGVSVVVTKDRNPANPTLWNGFDANPGVPSNDTVLYSVTYSLNRNVQNLTIELPYPTGCYNPIGPGADKEYAATYIPGSSTASTTSISGAPACSSKDKLVWNLGDKLAGTTAVLNASFKIREGPPNGVILRTKAKIFGSDYTAVTLPNDSLNIQSQAFYYSTFISPEFIAPNRTLQYNFRLGSGGYWYQSDMFNARYELAYSACINDNTPYTPVVTPNPGGVASITIDTTANKIIWNFNSPITSSTPNLYYTVTFQTASSCGATVGGTLTFYSEQDATFNKVKTHNPIFDPYNQTALPKWDSTATPRVTVWKDGGPNPSGAGQSVGYNLRFEQKSNVPLTDFYVIDKIPTQTTFISTYMYPGVVYELGATPKSNWKTYWSNKSTQPTRTDSTWVEFTGSPRCSGGCKVAAGLESTVKWVKFDVGVGGSFYWDRNSNYDPPIANLSIVTDPSASGTITNTTYTYAGNICTSGCTYNYSITIDNKPYFSTSYIPCPTDTDSNGYPENCGINNPLDVTSEGNYWISTEVWNSSDYSGVSHGDASNVKVTLRLPNREFLDNNPIDTTAGATFARCWMATGYSNTCPDVAGTLQTNPNWLYPVNNSGAENPSVTCPSGGGSGSCILIWNIPKIYSSYKYPQVRPDRYSFFVKLKTKLGLINQTTICNGTCEITVSSTPAPANTNFPKDSSYEVRVLSNPELTVSKTNMTPNNIPYGGSVQFKVTYSNNSNGATADAAVIDALPFPINPADGSTPKVSPLPQMIYSSYSAPNGESVYFITNRSRTGAAPLPNDSAWQPIANISGQQQSVDWIMWKRNSQFNIGDSKSVYLTVVDTGSPNGTVFQNLAYVSFLNGASYTTPSTFTYFPALASENLGSRVTIVNPGFPSTANSNVGSVSGFSFQTKSSNCGTVCTTTYLGISGKNQVIDGNYFNSAKNWLLSSYTFAAQDSPAIQSASYSSMYKDYGKKAIACSSEADCFSGSETVKIFTVSSGNTFKISSANANYSGVPRILFIDRSGGGDALEINENFTVASNTALLFVVNGNVKVNYGVMSIDGVYLVDGQFATGRRVNDTTGDAGRFATISIGRDGFARVVYLAGNNIRLITCKDLDCQNRDYGYIASVNADDIKVLKMTLYESTDGKDYPKIVIGLKDSTGKSTVKFISCKAVNCLDTSPVVNTYEDAQDPDIIIHTSYTNPSYIFGTGASAPRALTYRNCFDSDCSNPAPPAAPVAPIIDGGSGTGADKGNEVNYGLDLTPPVVKSAIGTYVDRSPGKNDLWFARYRWSDSGNCPGDYPATSRWWDCTKLVTGNVGYYHGATTHPSTGHTAIGYYDLSTKEIKYIACEQNTCTSTQSRVIDCAGGTACQAVDYKTYVSTETYSVWLYNLYTVRNTSTNQYEVKLARCNNWSNNTYCRDNAWTILPSPTYSISNNPSNPSGPYEAGTSAYSWQQGLALGRGASEVGFPRIVFFDEQGKNLTYARCKTNNCSDINYKQVDRGESIALPDKQLTINGSVISYGNNVTGGKAIALERDLFINATILPGEIFNFQPKYYYLLRSTIKEPEFISETPP